MNLSEFTQVVTKEVEAAGGTVYFPQERAVKLNGELLECNGYWDFDSMTFAAAMDQPKDAILRLLVHEYGHFTQWKENREIYWLAVGNHPMAEKFGQRNIESMFFGWLEGSEEYSQQVVEVICNVAKHLELDCERTTVELIRKYDLPIDLEDYIRRACAYVYFYNTLPETRKWYAVGKEPYNIPELLQLMPTTLENDFAETPLEAIKIMKERCLE
jgi:hypothetical protein